MGEVFLRRLGFMILTMLLVSMVIFFISEVVPIDVARNVLGQFATKESVEKYREQNGLNCPATVRYVIWLTGDDWLKSARNVVGENVVPNGCTPANLVRRGLLRGDMGTSFSFGTAVAPLLWRRTANSLILAGIAFIAIVPISLFFGLLAGLKENSFADKIINIASLATTSTPAFALGSMLVVIFSLKLHLLPGVSAMTTESSVLQSPAKLVMPVLVLFFSEAGYVARMTRASMVEVMATPYIRAAVLKGIPYRQVVFRHALKNALLAPITVVMLHVSWLIGGIVVEESLFAYPGLGRLLLDAALRKDVNVIECGALLMTFVATATQLLADAAYVYLNPRIRYQ